MEKYTDMDDKPYTFDEQLSRLKEAAGVPTDTALAKLIGITPGGFSGARRRGKIPNKWFVLVSSRFNVSVEWLMNGGERPERAEQPPRTDGGQSAARMDYDVMQAIIEGLRKENALLRELADAREEALRDKDETLAAFRQMLDQLQGTVSVLEKEGIITTGAPAYAPGAPSTNRPSK